MKKLSAGFTLIELLIVIGVLGILASGLLAAVDPFEQLKKARDANTRNATVELMNAFTRYYATHGAFPWNLAIPVVCDVTTARPGALSTAAVEINSMKDCVTSLENDGELKPNFVTNVTSDMFVASDPADKTDIKVCFAPEGKALRSDANTKYHLDSTTDPLMKIVEDTDGGVLVTDCPNVSTSSCLQCFE